MPAVKGVEFVSDRILYIILRGHWYDIIALNIHAPTEDENDDVKDSFREELGRVFDKLPKYNMKILLGDFSAKVGREVIFKATIWNESCHKISYNNGVKVVNCAISKNLTGKSKMFMHLNIHKFSWETPQSD
jgi:hypothetical protein